VTKIQKELAGPGFHSEVRVPYSALARKVGSHKETVRLAVKRAERSQFIREWRALLNPLLIGQKLGSLHVEARLDGNEKTRAISQIRLIEGVAIIANYHGGSLRVAFYYESEESAERKIRLIASICDVKNEDTTFMKVDLSLRGTLKKTDWIVIKAISQNPRRKNVDIALELGLSSRTVNRRIRKITESRAIFLIALVDVEDSVGLSVNYLVRCSDQAKGEIDNLLEVQRLVFATPTTNEYYTALLVFKNISEAERFKEKLGKVPGVKEVRMYLLKEHIFVDSWLDGIIQRNAASSLASQVV